MLAASNFLSGQGASFWEPLGGYFDLKKMSNLFYYKLLKTFWVGETDGKATEGQSQGNNEWTKGRLGVRVVTFAISCQLGENLQNNFGHFD